MGIKVVSSNMRSSDVKVIKTPSDELVTKGELDNAIADAKEDIYESIDVSTANLADTFSSESSYSTGDYVIYQDVLYKFTANHSGAWSSSDVEAVKVCDEIDDITANDVIFSQLETYGNNTVGKAITDLQDEVGDTVKVINVLKYGVLNNNNGNQATKINELINACTDGDTIYLPRGTYRITDPIVINKQINFICDGNIRGVQTNADHCVKITTGHTNVKINMIECATGNSNGLLITPDDNANMEYINVTFGTIKSNSSSTLDALLIKTTGSYFVNYVNITGNYIEGNNNINCIGIVKNSSGNIGEARFYNMRLNKGSNAIYMADNSPSNGGITGISYTNISLETATNGIYMKNVKAPSFIGLRCGEQQANNLLTIEGSLVNGYLISKNSIKLTNIDITDIDSDISFRSAFFISGVVYDSDIDTVPKIGALIYGGSIHKLLANEAT